MILSKLILSQPDCDRACIWITITSLQQAVAIEFIDENGGGPGVRLRKRQQKKTLAVGGLVRSEAAERDGRR